MTTTGHLQAAERPRPGTTASAIAARPDDAVRRLVRRALACPASAPSPMALGARWRLRAAVLRLAALHGAPAGTALRRAAWTLDTAAARVAACGSRAGLLRLLGPTATPRQELAAVAEARALVAAELGAWLAAHPQALTSTVPAPVPAGRSRSLPSTADRGGDAHARIA